MSRRALASDRLNSAVRPVIDQLEPRMLLAAGDFKLQILHASDLEGGVPALDDAPRFSAVMNGLRDDFANTVILSSGDNWIPSPFYTAGADPSLTPIIGPADKGRADMAIMNAIGFQAAAFGNHEFDEGTARISAILRPTGAYPGANFPYLSSNLNFSANADLSSLVVADGQEASANKGKIAKSAVITVNGVKFGLVGATTPLLPNISSPGTVTVKPTGAVEPLSAANLTGLAAEIQPVIDALTAAGIKNIIVMTHLQNLTNEQALAPLLKDVDVLIGGGSNRRLTDASDRLRVGDVKEGDYPIVAKDANNNPLVIVNTDGNYKYVGRLVIDFNPTTGLIDVASIDPVVSGAWATDAQGVIDAGNAAADPQVVAITDALRAVISVKDGRVFGKTSVYLNGERAGVRTEETNFGNLTADANMFAGKQFDSGVVISLKNGGGIRDPIGEINAAGQKVPPQANAFKPAGAISQLDIENSLRFNNALSLVSVNATQLKAIMEHGVAASGQQGRYPQIGGFSFSYDPARNPGHRIRSLAIKDAKGNTVDLVIKDGVIVGDPNRTFRMVTLSFLASGGDGYPFPTTGLDRVDLATGTLTFDSVGGEQKALADYLAAFHASKPFNQADQIVGKDGRIQNLSQRSDTVPTPKPTATIQLAPTGTLKAFMAEFDSGASEISAFDHVSKRLFVTNAKAKTLDIFNAANISAPAYITSVSLNGRTPNSVAVKDGLVAVAVDGSPTPQAAGSVRFYDTNGAFLQEHFIGSVPDMLTFTPDGKYLLIANEGEPSTDLALDPEGSITIINLSNGKPHKLPASSVKTATFSKFNNIKQQLINQGIRLFAPWKTVAQDLEPEYLAVSPDSKTAYVTLQENNALAVVNIASAQVEKLIPLGYKSYGPTTTLHEFKNLPNLGTTIGGQTIKLGGFSGLLFEGVNPQNGNLMFVTHPDRGPNPEPQDGKRPFALPSFQTRMVRFELNRTTGQVVLGQQILLTREDGVTPISGLPNTIAGTPGLKHVDEIPVDVKGNPLAVDPYGADLEGIVRAADGTYWMGDEYRPAIYHFQANGRLIERFVPVGTAAAAGKPAGFFGTEALPEIFAQRRANRGFEAIAIQNGKIYAFIQSPIDNPDVANDASSRGSTLGRIAEFDPVTKTVTAEYAYIFAGGLSDKIGDAVSIGNGEFLVVERDDAIGAAALKKVFKISLAGATNLQTVTLTGALAGKTIETLSAAERTTAGITTVAKLPYVDLITAGYSKFSKVEGLAVIDANTIAVLNDNDFTVGGAVNFATVQIAINPNAETPTLGIITLAKEGLDFSDRDNKINVANTTGPIFGMYQPDAIAAFTAGGKTYLGMVNEGDVREYEALNELSRVADLKLDPDKFPNAADIQRNAVLGRLRVTNRLGDVDNDGDFDALYAFGGRSFTIRDTDGKIIFDTGDELEKLIGEHAPAFFNSSSTNNTFDDRSDDKGPEPEALTVGEVNGRTYAFIGLERDGGIVIYDITDPAGSKFVQYLNPRDFTANVSSAAAGDLGPEGLVFVPAAQSPSGKALLIVSNEISGTTSIYEINIPGAPAPAIAVAAAAPAKKAAPAKNVLSPEAAAILPRLELFSKELIEEEASLLA